MNRRTPRWVGGALLVAAILAPTIVSAQPSTTHVRVAKVFSTLDGLHQAIGLEVVRVGATPLVLAGTTVSVRDTRGNVRSFKLTGAADELLGAADGQASRTTATILSSAWLGGLCDYDYCWGDFEAPYYVLPIDGGTIVIDGMDEWSYQPLPVDGRTSRLRNGSDFIGDELPFYSFGSGDVMLREFHNASLDHYFMTARLDEMMSLARGDVPGWSPTGVAIWVSLATEHEFSAPVCRFLLLDPQQYSHFFSAFGDECAVVNDSAGVLLEAWPAFYASQPQGGECPEYAIWRHPNGAFKIVEIGSPVYRLWNQRTPTNHRYVTGLAERDAMIARGWRPEGAGALGIAWCAFAADYIPPPP